MCLRSCPLLAVAALGRGPSSLDPTSSHSSYRFLILLLLSVLFLIICLLLIGVFSLLERVLLAAVQYRQGPMTAMLHGFAQVVADGLKIYSKYSLDVLAWASGLLVLGFTFSTYVGLSLLVYSSSLLPSLASDMDLLLYLCISGLLGILCLVPTVTVSNRYVAIGCTRQLRAMILADIGLETSIVVLLLFFITLDSSSDHLGSRVFALSTYLVMFTPVFILVLIAAARAPFDLPEAESELVSGPLTDVGGSAFSFCLLLDYLEVMT